MANRSFLILLISLFVLLGQPCQSFALEDPTDGKPFFEWLWEDQYRPTLKAATQTSQLMILTSGAALTAASVAYDDSVRAANVNHQRISGDLAQIGSQIGSGPPGVGIALAQLVLDQKAGLAHLRALTLTSATHFSMAHTFKRERPNGGSRLSFPSGHNSSAFASATSLAYSYGWKAGVPAYTAAVFVTAARLADDTHWFSDVVAGSTLGFFWGRASALADRNKEPQAMTWAPVLVDGGGLLVFNWEN